MTKKIATKHLEKNGKGVGVDATIETKENHENLF